MLDSASKDVWQVERAEDSDSDNSQLHSRTTSINGRMRSCLHLHQCQPKDKSAAEDGRKRAEVCLYQNQSDRATYFSRSTPNIILCISFRGETKISLMNNWISVNMYYVCIMYSYYLISRWMIFDIITENWSRPPGCDRGGWGGVRDVTRQDQCNPTRGGASQ